MLERKQAQLNSLRQTDANLEQLLVQTREKISAYQSLLTPEIERPKGLLSLGKKTEDGRIVPVSTVPGAVVAAE